MDILKSYTASIPKFTIRQSIPYILIITALAGFYASFTLTLEHIAVYKDPSHQLSCSIDPVLACGPIMQSKEATVFGFPNPLLGIGIFAVQAMIGVVLLAGARMKAWFWRLYLLAFIGGLGFTAWLVWHSLYVIGAICIYCFVVWVAMIMSSWYLLQYMLAENYINLKSKRLKLYLRKHHGDLLLVFYILLFALILQRFWYYYGPKLGF